MSKVDHTTSKQADYAAMSVKDFLQSNNGNISAFIQTKLASACQLLMAVKPAQYSNNQWRAEIAEKLRLTSADSVANLIERWGSHET